jgi:hypothetical protein
MPLAFLVPLFLAGLAALVIPVLVHLRHRERKEPVRFPSLMFLRRVPFREVSRQQIHHWPLFLLRCLVVALLAAAFARPFFRNRSEITSLAARPGRDVVILLDRSASMGYGGRWERARVAAEETIALLGTGDRAALVPFDAAPALAVPLTDDRTLLHTALADLRPSGRPTRFAPALRTARDLLMASEQPERELVVISDFQRSGWRGELIEPLPQGTTLRAVNLATPNFANVAVVSAEVSDPGDGPTVRADLLATGAAGPGRVRVSLAFDGRPGGVREVTLADAGAARLTFPPARRSTASVRGVLRAVTGDSLAADDVFHLALRPERPLRVVVKRAPGGRAGAFLDRALGLSRRPRITVIAPGAPLGAELRDVDVVVLDDVPYPGGAEGARLTAFIQAGGGLLHVAGPSATGAWPRALVGLRVGDVVERPGGTGGTIGSVRREHPVFEPFRAPGSGDFADTRVYRYRRLAEDSVDVLARFDDGAPALVELPPTAGRGGRALLLATSVDNIWNDLPLQPVFLPLAHQLVLYAAGHVEPEPWHAVGGTATVGAERLGGASAVVIVSPSGGRSRREPTGEGVTFVLEETGFYEVREAGPGGRLLEIVAANPSAEEADLTAFDPADLVVAAGGHGARETVGPVDGSAGGRGERSQALTAAEQERSQSLWWFALAGVALLASIELLFANRLTSFIRSGPAPAREAS